MNKQHIPVYMIVSHLFAFLVLSCSGTKVIKEENYTTIKYGDPKIVMSFPKKWDVQQSIEEDRLSVLLNVETYKINRGNDTQKSKPGVTILCVVDKEQGPETYSSQSTKLSYKNFILQSFKSSGNNTIRTRSDIISLINKNKKISESEAWAFQITDKNEQKKLIIFGLQIYKENKTMTIFFQVPVKSFANLKNEFIQIIRSIQIY